ncbi:hypothetical protein [Neobacillus dielmonensis]|uniref:hypothetical protein n=1 Tax=Neobacillus dielmonensis TaxID=1347369 RepID=UPI0005A98F46|nr:hypothetical protein [Neobacillus dielmonensis]
MAQKLLEFRGIKLGHLGMYFEELGAERITDEFPFVYSAENWIGEILSEQEISFTSSFKVNTVTVRFQAENQEKLEELIKNYRYKTTRIGG